MALRRMPSGETFHKSRRSTRVPLKVVITVEAGNETQTCDGETIIVSLHGALIATAIELGKGMRISIYGKNKIRFLAFEWELRTENPYATLISVEVAVEAPRGRKNLALEKWRTRRHLPIV